MGEIKSVGQQPVSSTAVHESAPDKSNETSHAAKQAAENAQPLSAEDKAAKTSEWKMAGEAMRHVLEQGLKSAVSSAQADISAANKGGAQILKTGVGAAAKAIVDAAIQKLTSKEVQAPSGVPYKAEARVPDNTPIFKDGKLDREKVLENLTQHDQNAKTTEDKDRCGGTAAIASAINSGGEKGLLKLTAAMKNNLPQKEVKELNDIEARIKNKTATHGDLGRLSELIHNGFAQPDPTGGKGILDGDMHSIYTQAGMKPPKNAGDPEKIFQNGQSWPVNLDTDGDGNPNHWVVAGKDDKGRVFIYDPDSTPGKPQIHYKGSPEYDSYLQQMKKTNSGFAPLTQADADKARDKYYSEAD